jgi:transposase
VGEKREGSERNLPGLGSVFQSDLGREETEAKKEEETRGAKPRYEAIDREQLSWRVVDVERLIGEEHPARAIWEFVGKLDLSGYSGEIRAVEGQAGRPAWDPRLLISLWVYAYSEGVGSARTIEELCEWEAGYQWLTGGRVVNAHTLSDFRVKHEQRLNELFVQVLGLLTADGLITLERVMQDGTKIRASAASDSFRRKERIEQGMKRAQEQVAAVSEMSEEETSRRAAKARQRAQRERKERLCRVPPDSEHWISESCLANNVLGNQPRRTDGQTESVDSGEALSNCERGAEPKGTDGTDRQTAPSLRGIDLSVAGEVLRRWQSGVGV